MSDTFTPRTDAKHHEIAQDLESSDLYKYHQMKTHARELELDLATANSKIAELRHKIDFLYEQQAGENL